MIALELIAWHNQVSAVFPTSNEQLSASLGELSHNQKARTLGDGIPIGVILLTLLEEVCQLVRARVLHQPRSDC